MAKRKTVSKKARFEVFKRDSFTCQYCGSAPPAVVLEVDHIVPVCEGGENEQDNLTTSCFNCNRGKAGNSLELIPQSLADKAAQVKESEEQIKGYHEILSEKKNRIEDEAWSIAEVMEEDCSKNGFRIAWLTSIKGFLSRLDYYEVEEAMEIAVARVPYPNNKTFRYFCGVCWNKVNEDA